MGKKEFLENHQSLHRVCNKEMDHNYLSHPCQDTTSDKVPLNYDFKSLIRRIIVGVVFRVKMVKIFVYCSIYYTHKMLCVVSLYN